MRNFIFQYMQSLHSLNNGDTIVYNFIQRLLVLNYYRCNIITIITLSSSSSSSPLPLLPSSSSSPSLSSSSSSSSSSSLLSLSSSSSLASLSSPSSSSSLSSPYHHHHHHHHHNIKLNNHISISSLQHKLQILSLKDRAFLKSVSLVHNLIYSNTSNILSERISYYRSLSSLRSAKSVKINVPKYNYETIMGRSFCVSAPTNWN